MSREVQLLIHCTARGALRRLSFLNKHKNSFQHTAPIHVCWKEHRCHNGTNRKLRGAATTTMMRLVEWMDRWVGGEDLYK